MLNTDCKSQSQADDMGFPSADYRFPLDGDTFTGTLVFKKWSEHPSLMTKHNNWNKECISR